MRFSRDEIRELSLKLDVLKLGKIVQAWPETHTYSIQTADCGFVKGKPAMLPRGGYLRGQGMAEILQPGTQVIYYHNGATGFILGCLAEPGIPGPHVPPVTYGNIISNKEAPPKELAPKLSYRGGNPPDLLPGDFVRYTEEGGFIALLKGGLAKMGANSMASIEFNPIDDLTTINGRNLDVNTDHYEVKVYNDEGETNAELYAAPNFFEAVGSDSPEEELGTHSEGEGKLRYRAEPYDRMGKWRVHAFSGWLGDTLHLFVSQRGTTNQRLDTETSRGLTEIMLSHDGSVRVRSCRELVLEKVSKIHVPKKIREAYHNDKGDSKDTGYNPSPHEVYEWDEDNKEGRRMQETEYHNHTVDHEEIRHFRDHNKDWNIESETSSDKPEPAKDIYEGQETGEYDDTYAIIRLRSDGSFYVEDTWGSCIDTNCGDISLSAKRDIRIQAGRDLLLSGAREGALRTQEDINIVSHSGAARLKANTDLRLFGEGNASLDAGTGNVGILSRQGATLIRSERGDVTLKSDLGNIEQIAVSGAIDLRSSQEIDILSDASSVKIHSLGGTQISSKGGILIGIVDKTTSMSAVPRNSGNFTNTSLAIDNGNTIDSAEVPSFLQIGATSALLKGATSVQVSGGIASVFSAGGTLDLGASSASLTSVGSLNLVRNDTFRLGNFDDDGDDLWIDPGAHLEKDIPTAGSTALEGVRADVKAVEFADTRFRYKGEFKEDHVVYQYPWQNMNPGGITPDLRPWVDIIPIEGQDVPDVGSHRPISGDSQGVSTGETEQILPYSNYKEYTYGQFSWENGVVPGNFSETINFLVPQSGSSITTVTDDESVDRGRVNLIPDSANGESFKGDLDKSEFEDPINERLTE